MPLILQDDKGNQDPPTSPLLGLPPYHVSLLGTAEAALPDLPGVTDLTVTPGLGPDPSTYPGSTYFGITWTNPPGIAGIRVIVYLQGYFWAPSDNSSTIPLVASPTVDYTNAHTYERYVDLEPFNLPKWASYVPVDTTLERFDVYFRSIDDPMGDSSHPGWVRFGVVPFYTYNAPYPSDWGSPIANSGVYAWDASGPL